MSEKETKKLLENPIDALVQSLIDCAGIRTRAQIVNKFIKADDKDKEFELATDELDEAIETLYKVESLLGEALKNHLVAVGTEIAL